MNRVSRPHERTLSSRPALLGTTAALRDHVANLSAPLPDDYRFLETVRSVMLIGPPALTRDVSASLSRNSHGPIVWVTAGQQLSLPAADDVGTLIVQAIEDLSEPEQRRFCEWLDEAPRARVITTSPRPLLDGLATGEFLPTLYYRLNTVYIDFTTTS